MPSPTDARADDRRLLPDFLYEFRRHKDLADRALGSLDDEQFFHRPAEHVNSVAIIVKHLSGNLRSRWTDFLTSDGEKPDRRRDGEFVIAAEDTRASLMAAWEHGWEAVLATVAALRDSDLQRTITIRGEPHTVLQALVRGLTHAAYHVGQVLYLARMLRPEGPWLTIAPRQSDAARGGYLKPRG
jgi:uncharacterized damage-inducible protein DinB